MSGKSLPTMSLWERLPSRRAHAGSEPQSSARSKTWETSVGRIDSWPEDAMPLKTYTWISYLYLIGDIVLALLPLFFILLGVAVVALNGRPTRNNDFGSKVEFAIQLSPTLFPIVFAAIIGRSLKMIARYHAERGVHLGTLELLMASQSVWGTIECQLLLQRLTIVGANLLFLWALSPLGGQASLRLMSRKMTPTHSSTKIRYMTTGPAATAFGIGSSYEDSGRLGDAASLYTAAIMAPQSTKLSSRDIWGNLKIPRLESFNVNNSDATGWIDVPANMTSPESFSALVGLPVVGLPSNGTSSFNLESTYMSVTCGNMTRIESPNFDEKNGTSWNLFDEVTAGAVAPEAPDGSSPLRPFGNRSSSSNCIAFKDLSIDKEDSYGFTRTEIFMGNYNQALLNNNTVNGKREVFYISLDNGQFDTTGNSYLNIASCSLAQTHVKVLVHCEKTLCSVSKIRKSLTDGRPASFTGFDHGLVRYQFANKFPMIVPQSDGSNPTDRFLVNTSTLPLLQQVGWAPTDTAWVNISQTTPELFSQRLSVLWNTYYQLSVQPTGYQGDLPANLSLYGPDTIPVTDINVWLPGNLSATNHSFLEWWTTFRNTLEHADAPFIGATTSANITTLEERFVCNFAWLALLWGAAGIVFLIGLVSLALKHKTLGPEIFGFVTSMTYHNPYITLPPGGSRLDAMERARLLKDVEVCIADVRGDDDVGHIALAAGVTVRKLEKERLYH